MGFLRKLKNLLSTRAEITIQIIDKNFNRIDPTPVQVEGLEVDREIRKVMDLGHSNAMTLKGGWVNHVNHRGYIKQQLITDKEGKEYWILLCKPKEEEIPI